MGRDVVVLPAERLDLNDPDAESEKSQSDPLRPDEPLAEHQDGEARGREDLHLREDGERRDIEVGGGYLEGDRQ